jgi:hypothetical protein
MLVTNVQMQIKVAKSTNSLVRLLIMRRLGPRPPLWAAAVATGPTQTPVASPANCEAAAEGHVSATGQVAPNASHPKESAELAGTRRMLQAHHLIPLIDPA